MSSFDQNKLEEIVSLSDLQRRQYFTAPYIKIVHKSPDVDTTPTVICESFPEPLAKVLWPKTATQDHETYGKAIVLNLEATGEGASEAVDWLRKSIENGSHDDMAWGSFNVDHIFTVMHEAAIAIGIDKLIDVTETGLGRLATGEQKDASETVEN